MSKRSATTAGFTSPGRKRQAGPRLLAANDPRVLAIARAGRSIPRPMGPPASLRTRGPEIKSVDYPLAAAAPYTTQISTTASIVLLNGIQEGAGLWNRVGRKIMMKSLHLTGQIYNSGSGTGVNEYCRVMVVYDRQPVVSALPVITDILRGYDQAGTAMATAASIPFLGLNMDNADRFTMLRDIRFVCGQNSASALTDGVPDVVDYVTNRVNINEFIKLRDLETHYGINAAPITIANVNTGALYLVTVGNVTLAAPNAFSLAACARLRYYDN